MKTTKTYIDNNISIHDEIDLISSLARQEDGLTVVYDRCSFRFYSTQPATLLGDMARSLKRNPLKTAKDIDAFVVDAIWRFATFDIKRNMPMVWYSLKTFERLVMSPYQENSLTNTKVLDIVANLWGDQSTAELQVVWDFLHSNLCFDEAYDLVGSILDKFYEMKQGDRFWDDFMQEDYSAMIAYLLFIARAIKGE